MTKAKARDVAFGAALLISLGFGVNHIVDQDEKLDTTQAKVEVAKPLGEQVREACTRDRFAVEREFGISCDRGEAVAQELSTKDVDINDPEPDDPEIQDPEIQDPEIQDPEIDDPDPDDPETQESEIQDPEIQEDGTLTCPPGWNLEELFSDRNTPEPEDDREFLLCSRMP